MDSYRLFQGEPVPTVDIGTTFCSVTGSDGFRAYEHRRDEYCPICVPEDGVPDVTEPKHSYEPDD